MKISNQLPTQAPRVMSRLTAEVSPDTLAPARPSRLEGMRKGALEGLHSGIPCGLFLGLACGAAVQSIGTAAVMIGGITGAITLGAAVDGFIRPEHFR
jgi:hypothetical protein